MTSSTSDWEKAVRNIQSDKSDVWSKRSTAQNSVATPLPKAPRAVYSSVYPFGSFLPFHCRVHRISQRWQIQQARQDPTVCNSWLNVYAQISQTATSFQALRPQFCVHFSFSPSRYIYSLFIRLSSAEGHKWRRSFSHFPFPLLPIWSAVHSSPQVTISNKPNCSSYKLVFFTRQLSYIHITCRIIPDIGRQVA
jgi:hypothetical protein